METREGRVSFDQKIPNSHGLVSAAYRNRRFILSFIRIPGRSYDGGIFGYGGVPGQVLVLEFVPQGRIFGYCFVKSKQK